MNGLSTIAQPNVKSIVHGRCHWAVQPVTLPEGWQGILEITSYTQRGEVTARYVVEENRINGRLAGYRLTKDDGEVYDLDLEWGWSQATCTCGDHTFRSRTCKHAKALQAALKRLEA